MKKKMKVSLDVKMYACCDVEVEATSIEDAEEQVRALVEERGVESFEWHIFGPNGEVYIADHNCICADDDEVQIMSHDQKFQLVKRPRN